MTTGIGIGELSMGVGGVHDGLIAAAGGLLSPFPASPARPGDPGGSGADSSSPQPDVYGGAGVPSPGKVSDTHPKAPPYPGTDGGSPYGLPIPTKEPATPPLIGAAAGGAPAGTAPLPPAGAGGLSDGAGQAGDDYKTSGGRVQGLDDRLTQEINDAVSQNQAARDKINSILSEMKIVQRGLAYKSDPLALSEYQKYLDQQLGAVQRVLDDAKVSATAKQQILKDIAAEYNAAGPAKSDAGASAGNAAGEERQASGADGESGGEPGAAAGEGEPSGAAGSAFDDGGAIAGQSAPGGLIDPFAGMGPMGAMNPMMGGGLGDALGQLGGLGGSLGSSLAGLGAAPLGALGPALGSLGGLGQLGGPGGGFTDQPAALAKDVPEFKDDKPAAEAAATDVANAGEKAAEGGDRDKPLASEDGFRDDDAGGSGAEQIARDTAAGEPGSAAPAAAAPASAPDELPVPPDAARLVTLPDGTPVTAPSEQAANAARAVLAGQSVTDAYKAQGVDIAPPGTPVTSPVDPSRLQPGDIASFGSRPPVMALGNGKIFMDGQIQPLSALGSSGDFLGWSKPAAPAMVAHAVTPLVPAAPTMPPVGPSATIPPSPPRPS